MQRKSFLAGINFQALVYSSFRKRFDSTDFILEHKRNNSKKNDNTSIPYYKVDDKNLCFKSNPVKESITLSAKDKSFIAEWLKMCKFDGEKVPQKISEENLLELFQRNEEKERIHFLRFLVTREILSNAFKEERRKVATKKLKLLKERRSRPVEHIDYYISKNCPFILPNSKTVKDLLYHRWARALRFGQPLVIDMGFDSYLHLHHIGEYVRQLVRTISINRVNVDPINLIFCNVNFDSKSYKRFKSFMPSIEYLDFPMIITPKSYLEMFPKEKLIYLTKDAKCEMQEFDYDAIYVIGGIVDYTPHKPLTLEKAKKEKIRTLKLPLDRYLIFKESKHLPIDVVMAIILKLYNGGTWEEAFEYVPRRMLRAAPKRKNIKPLGIKKFW